MSPTPLVSCIMPTRNRRRFVGQAIWYFLRQDYPERELIVVDDGEDAVSDLIPDDRRIRYIRLDRRTLLGAKRNLACEVSAGELIAHWDDDDWSAPTRLSSQVAELLLAGADVCGARDLLHYRLDHGDAWLYRCPPQERSSWLAGCTLLFRRSAWAAHRFPEINVGEDGAFIASLPAERVHPIEDSSFYVALVHSHNTAAKHLADPRWERRPLEEVTRRIALDREFYVALRTGGPTDRTSVSSAALPTITVSASFAIASGYGSMSEYLVLGMLRAGARVQVAPVDLDPTGLSPELAELLARPPVAAGGPVLYFNWIRPELNRYRAASLYINTMWESDRLPAGWPEQLNRARAVIVPTRFVARACRESGVVVPIEVVPEGVDPDVYHYLERPARPGLTTLIVGPVDDRKHVRTGIAAWARAFTGDPDARLIVKSHYQYHNYVPDDPRIQYLDFVEPTRGIARWYQQADVLLALGNEGFGLPLVEAMATGLPVVALDSEGQSDVCHDARDYLLPIPPVDRLPYSNNLFGACGHRGVPGVDDVVARLQWVATHRDEASALGRAASDWAVRNRNIWRKGPAVLDLMEQYAEPKLALRRRRTVWVPSWGTPCGIAEYTAHLTRSMHGVQATARPPDVRNLQVLHIQQENSLFDDTELTWQVQAAAQASVPVVVTEHGVDQRMRAWERDADVLVALTERGAGMLRSRWPAKRIERLPIGCPTWFPPRKRTRGRVIGAFGFLTPHKGFWRLLDVLRAAPGTELLLFSHAKSAELEARWNAAASGLPVRRIGEYLPVEEIARRLAAEADILVYWYDQFPHASASYAVRIGLASGVPVLTSPTSWFEELQAVTYQPTDLGEGVQRLLEDTTLRDRVTGAAADFCHAESWPYVAESHVALWASLERS